jgi:hypothetical protein
MLQDDAFNYTMAAGGLHTTAMYGAYQAWQGACKLTNGAVTSAPEVQLIGYTSVPEMNEAALLQVGFAVGSDNWASNYQRKVARKVTSMVV